MGESADLPIPYAFVTEVDKFQVSEPVFDHVSEPVQKPVQKYRQLTMLLTLFSHPVDSTLFSTRLENRFRTPTPF